MRRLLLLGGVAAALGLAWWALSAPDEGADVGVRSASIGAEAELRALQGLEVPPPAVEAHARRAREALEQPLEPAPGAASLTVRVRHVDGLPAAGARVLLVARERLLASEATDAMGAVDLPRAPAGAEVLALHPLLGAARAALGPETDWVELILDEGGLVAGVVRIDGLTPRVPIELGLESSPVTVSSSLPGAAKRLLHRLAAQGQRARTAAGGKFAFRVPQGWRGRLELPADLVLEDGASALELSAAAPDLVLELRSLPALRGRVLAPDGATPAVGARVAASGRHPDGRSLSAVEQTGEDGRFAILLDGALPTLVLDGARGEGHLELELREVHPPLDPSRSHDLGDLVLEPASELAFLVRDPSGAPIEGARGHSAGTGVQPSAPTGADGRGVLRGLVESSAAASFVAPAHEPRAVELSWPLPDELEVELVPCAALEVALMGPDGGSPPTGVAVEFLASEPFEAKVSRRGRAAGRSVSSGLHAGGGFRFGSADERGVRLRVSPEVATGAAIVRIDCVEVGVPIAVRVVDDLGTPISDLGTVRLDGPGTRRLEAVIEVVPRDFCLRVSSPEGEPIEAARIEVHAVELVEPAVRTQLNATTDSLGEVLIAGLLSERVELAVHARGFVSLLVRDMAVPEDGRTQVLLLDRGRAVELRLVDEQENPVAAQEVRGVHRGRACGETRELGPGHYRIEVLPAEPFELSALAGGRIFREVVPAARERVRIVVPEAGAVAIEWSASMGEEGGGILAVLAPVPRGRDRSALRASADRRADGMPEPLEFPLVFAGRYELRLTRQSRRADAAPPAPILVELGPGERRVLRLTPPSP